MNDKIFPNDFIKIVEAAYNNIYDNFKEQAIENLVDFVKNNKYGKMHIEVNDKREED